MTTTDQVAKKCVRKLKEKTFSERKSLITELLEMKHFKPIRHVFYSVLFGFVCNEIINVLVLNNDVNFGFRLIRAGFGKFHLVIISWCLQFSVNLLTFFLFKSWANARISMTPKSFIKKLWDLSFLSIFILYYVCGLYVVCKAAIFILDLPSVSSAILITEQIRLIMKAHAYVRSNAPKVLHFKTHAEQELVLPNLSAYVYFSFAPTLVYRDEYPRTKTVDRSEVFKNFVEVFLLIWFMSFVFDSFFISKFEHTGKSETNWKDVIRSIMENIIPGMLMMLFGFYLILHSWQNGFAEMLRFADRKFYEDWWTATNFSTFFRTWNIIVQDWLFAYIYKDFYEIVTPNNKVIPKLMVFLISAIVHEFVLIVMLRQFFPLLFINFFGLGMLLTFIETKRPVYNVFLWYALAFGKSMLLCLYTMEYYARNNCPVLDSNITVSSYLKPRIFAIDECT